MNTEGDTGVGEYNAFCRSITEGTILYNLDKANGWGEYLLVANISLVHISGYKTYTALLLGLKKNNDKLVPYNLRIKLTPDYSRNVPYLKCVGKCNFWLVPEISDVDLNMGLVVVYGDTNLRKYQKSLSIKKARKRRYGKDGKLVIKKLKNE